jgi:hypothetical protein
MSTQQGVELAGGRMRIPAAHLVRQLRYDWQAGVRT